MLNRTTAKRQVLVLNKILKHQSHGIVHFFNKINALKLSEQNSHLTECFVFHKTFSKLSTSKTCWSHSLLWGHTDEHSGCWLLIIKASGLYNFQNCRIPVFSRLNVSYIWQNLVNYSNYQVCDFLEYGWPMVHNGSSIRSSSCRSLREPQIFQNKLLVIW
jgi:hypothetical protein